MAYKHVCRPPDFSADSLSVMDRRAEAKRFRDQAPYGIDFNRRAFQTGKVFLPFQGNWPLPLYSRMNSQASN